MSVQLLKGKKKGEKKEGPSRLPFSYKKKGKKKKGVGQ